ncbi:MAG: Re/Si-specific NAD(P)(+) transhydrogenase subunit alpha [Actinomyces sp.]|uniref:Re/Si-specific NAD(P)(+) transhydrogenase subunit alpha n=1 Tax=Actinomyces sp. TaxID=29317 RepID=UPI0028048E60|nr:Re/Si-specific NAD(P)(+) transhydrogenase subunit alpha [Actinomyces sp.]MDU4287338.1 Re/Si-specific NAD(P)(+) transhydrogenase subunit alpha [Actinomyces sp.]MDU4831286.1 Re/Si-specific NAD(P)(+) transhydrogenase subunit alpha [Actinomyces sp.]MDU5231172.1 Re/Si-specific NAD(P)(+) transhydrogenase subunit alpha [Actinomyces sp.]MDU6756674.1 Re/Si-specific NAD(P)(+) transhydrogenase subunit alpha [Actinomyces sp.]
MRIGVPKEGNGQPLVAATPDTVKKLIALGYEVALEERAGELASYPDAQYQEAGARIATSETVWDSDIVLALDAPTTSQLDMMHEGATLIARLAPARNPELIEALATRGITALAMDTVPRISRAQSMDVLSSMANVAGYRAIIEAAAEYGRLFTGQVTAAGKMPPARVYVIGAGVAGLAAIGTANSMGAQVSATDVRPEVGEQVESMGADFVAIPAASEVSSDGYAKEMTDAQRDAALTLYTEQAATSDIVITTANVPGRKSPLLLTAQAVAGMKPGSVIVDMAAANGGNCELTVPGERVVTDNGVIILGITDLAGRLPAQSSQLYGQNIVNLLKLMTPEKDGQIVFDLEDEIVRGITITHLRDVMWPPPPVKVSAAPAAATPKPDPALEAAQAAEEARKEAAKKRNRFIWTLVAAVLGLALVWVSPAPVLGHYMVLALAIILGFYVITSVTHSLHTPLMSVTNAISGIILVGAILQVGSGNLLVSTLSFIAIVVASINIFGGFTVTHRMLAMFKKD